MLQSKSGTPQGQTTIIITITLFAIAGLVVGFAYGAFTRSTGKTQQPTSQSHDISVVSQKTQLTPSPISQTQPPPLGCPDVEANVSQMVADGHTPYQATIQAKDKTGNPGNTCTNIALEKPLAIDGLTCKIWLTKAQDPSADLSRDSSQLQHLDQLSAPSPDEIPSGLIFDPSTPQVQPCKQGQGNWKFTISPTVSPGDYYIVGLTDWHGTHYDWSWYSVTINNHN
jgi:hypothetical protein